MTNISRLAARWWNPEVGRKLLPLQPFWDFRYSTRPVDSKPLKGFGNEDQTPLIHHHMFFGYAFKEQAGWRELLSRFVEGGGTLLDLEYLTDDSGKRVTSFSRIAGYIGMAAGHISIPVTTDALLIGLLVWCHHQLQKQSGGKMQRSSSREGLDKLASADEIDKSIPLLQYVRSQLEKAGKSSDAS